MRLVLILILWLAFLLRANGLAFGLPYLYHDDEHQYVEAGRAFLQGREAALAQLHRLNNPPLFKSVLGAAYLLSVQLLNPDPAEVESQSWGIFFYYLGRFFSMSAGLLTVALLYALGRRLYGHKAGVLAAFFLAVSFLHVRESHFAVNDVPLTFLATAGLYACAGIFCRGRWFDYLAAGLLIGLAAATKYTGVYLGLTLLLAHHLRQGTGSLFRLSRWFSPRLLAALVMVGVGFVAGAPVVFTGWPEMLRRMAQLSEYGQVGYHDMLLAPNGGWIFYLNALGWGVGWLLLAAILAAVGLIVRYRPARDVLLLAFPLLLYALMGAQKMVFVRFILPAVPALVLLVAGWAERLGGRGRRLRPTSLLAVAAVLLAAQSAVMSGWLGVVLNRPDTRTQATDWLTANLPAGSVVYVETHAAARQSVSGRVSLPFITLDELSFDHPNPLAHYQDLGLQYIAASDYHHDRPFSDAGKEAGRQRWQQTLARLKVRQEFQPYRWTGDWFVFDQRYGPWYETLLRSQPGPVIRVYEVETGPAYHWLSPFVETNQAPGKLAVFGYELLPSRQAAPEQEVEVVLYWFGDQWQVSDELWVSVVDEAGFEWLRAQAGPLPDFAEKLGQKGEIIKSKARLLFPAGAPPGRYELRVEVYNRSNLQVAGSLWLDQAAFQVGQADLPLGTDIRVPAVALGPDINLVSHELSAREALMADTLVSGQDNWIVLFWQASRDIRLDYSVRLALLDEQDNPAAAWEGWPVHGRYATSSWQAGQLVRDPWNLQLPETVKPGQTYRLVLSLLEPGGTVSGSQVLGTFKVSERVRTSEVPAMQHSVDARWEGALSLLGFNTRAIPETPNSGWLEVDLYWESLKPVDIDYVVGLKLVDSQGQVVLGQEGQPKGGQAPASTWKPGEVVHDFHSLRYSDLAMNRQYRLEVTLTDPKTGQPLPVQKDGRSVPALLLTSWP